MIAARTASLQPECNLPRLSKCRPQRNTSLERLTDYREGKKKPDRDRQIKKIVSVSTVSDDLSTIIIWCLILVGLSHKRKSLELRNFT